MKLTYRGVAYDHNPPMLEVTESDVDYQYRGQSARYTYVRHVPIPQPAEHLSYRGVAYQTTRHGQVQQLQVTPAAQTAVANSFAGSGVDAGMPAENDSVVKSSDNGSTSENHFDDHFGLESSTEAQAEEEQVDSVAV